MGLVGRYYFVLVGCCGVVMVVWWCWCIYSSWDVCSFLVSFGFSDLFG